MTNQEAIDEAAERYIDNFQYDIAHPRRVCKNAFINGANWYKENESKNPIDFAKLRDEFFSECVDRRAFCEIGESFDRVVSLAPHDMFEWIKNKLTTKL